VRAREASSGTGDIFQGCFVSFVFFSLIGLLSKAESLGGCRGRDLYTDDLMIDGQRITRMRRLMILRLIAREARVVYRESI
jgi:hypothetical protein